MKKLSIFLLLAVATPAFAVTDTTVFRTLYDEINGGPIDTRLNMPSTLSLEAVDGPNNLAVMIDVGSGFSIANTSPYKTINLNSRLLEYAGITLNNGEVLQRSSTGILQGLTISALGEQVMAATSTTAMKSVIFTGTTSQYVRGDGSDATLNKSAVGLGNVDNTADSAKTFAASQVTSGTFADARIAQSNVTQHQTALSIAAGQITGTKTSSFISDFTTSGRNLISVTGNGSYNSSTGMITINNPGTRTFNYSTRTINTCFQISNTQDADATYGVDANILLSLGGGTAAMTTYTNSGCTTGAQAVANGAVSNVAIGGTASMPLHAIIPAGKWLKITGTVSGGIGSTIAVDAVANETLLP